MTTLGSSLGLMALGGPKTVGSVGARRAEIQVGGRPGVMAMLPNNRHLYVPTVAGHSVAAIATATNTVVRNPITFGLSPFVAAASPDSRAYM